MTSPAFQSTLNGSLDSKGRVCIPAPFRLVLASQNTNGVFICPSVFDDMLEGFGQTLLDEQHARLAAFDPLLSPEYDDIARAFVARTMLLPADEQGRVRLPDEMIAHAGLKDRVVFAGLSTKFQIWDAERYASVQAATIARLRAQRERAIAKTADGTP